MHAHVCVCTCAYEHIVHVCVCTIDNVCTSKFLKIVIFISYMDACMITC